MNYKKETWTLALCIAFFPPLWAVLAPYLHVNTGAVALICAGVFSANGNKRKDAIKITFGFLLGDLWAYIALVGMQWMKWDENLELFLTLFMLGGLAVLFSSLVPNWIYCPSWLCGWAIGLTIMGPMGIKQIGTYPIQIGVAMIVGVWYVGVFLTIVQNKMMKIGKTCNQNCEGEKIHE